MILKPLTSQMQAVIVGSEIFYHLRHQEYWIPSGDLEEFNQNIVGLIEVVKEFG